MSRRIRTPRQQRGGQPRNDDDDVPDGLLTEASLSHMSCSATEARPQASAEWIASHVRPQRQYRPLRGEALAASTYARNLSRRASS